MYLRSNSFDQYHFMSDRLAFGKPHETDHFQFGGNRNPHLEWGNVPDGTRSIVVVCWDPDVPSVGDDVNQEDRSVPHDLARVNFFHWVLVDLPHDLREIEEGAHSHGVTEGGKPAGPSASGGLQGANDFTNWFHGAGEPMEGTYCGYDGPAPPWNDERVHGYHFQVFALDIESLGLEGPFTGHKVMRTLRSHILASATLVGLYSMNPKVVAQFKSAVPGE